ncbi:MAG: cell division protein SepF [Clostridia bacterium]|nr:cell division protein SepF [Clostridia bacterium]MBR4186115.1 cell division protein SepF [Clostridia bacterium]
MGLMDRIKKVTGSNDTYDESYDEDYYDGFDNYDEGAEDGDVQYAAPQPQQGNAGPNPQPMGSLNLSGSNIKMQVVRPETYDSDTATQIANHLLNKCTVVLNLEKTTKEASRRLIDFLTGVAYSIGGDLKNIATNAYVITPSNVDVENAKIRSTPKQTEPEPEEETPAEGDFDDFN